MDEKKFDHEPSRKDIVNSDAIAAKLKANFSPDEIRYIFSSPEDIQEKVFKPDSSTSQSENGPLNSESGVEGLVKQHLLKVDYHVFQWFEAETGRDSTEQEFNKPIFKSGFGRNSQGEPPFAGIVSKLLSDKQQKRLDLEDHIKKHEDFVTTDGKSVKLGRAFLVQGRTDRGQDVVVIQGSFSTESNSNRENGRTNIDNQMLFFFDTQESADKFANLFNNSEYNHSNSEIMENNTKVIERALRSTNLGEEACNKIESRLLLGLEIIKVN